MELTEKDLLIKALKGSCKKQGKKIENQRKEIIQLNKKLIKKEARLILKDEQVDVVLKYLDKCLHCDHKLDFDAVLITTKFLLFDIKEK